jgi:hypothetical protein
MSIFNHVFPIFAFGLVMTGIVFLGLQRASDLAKSLAAERGEAERRPKIPGLVSPDPNGATAQVPTSRNRP